MLPALCGGVMLSRASRAEYAAHREADGRRLSDAELLELPYLLRGPHVPEWAVRARSFESLMHLVGDARPLRLLDLGAGNGWLSYRAALAGISAMAVDTRDDDIDGLG